MARGVKSDAQQCFTFSISTSSVVFRKVSSCPAQAAEAESSAVALERTATNFAPNFLK